jgi:hypothetical protein
MPRFVFLVVMTLLTAAPAMGLRISGWRPDPVVNTLVFGVAVLAAGLLLSWAPRRLKGTTQRPIRRGPIAPGFPGSHRRLQMPQSSAQDTEILP